MSVSPLPDVFGHTIFCDDVRFEDGGKLSLIGVYQGQMFIHADFPVTLPKFGIVVRYHERIGSRSDPLVLKIFLPGDPDDAPTFSAQVPVDELRKAGEALSSEEKKTENGEIKFHIMQAPIILSPFVLKGPGAIKVRAVCGDEIIRMGALTIEKAAVAPPISPNVS